MLLALDIGNSSINIGLYSGKLLVAKLKLPSSPVTCCNYYKNELLSFLSKNNAAMPLHGVIISSVVTELTDILNDSARDLAVREPMILSASSKTGIIFDIDNPVEVGADRIANVIAAKEKYGSPALVVDFGTATTISAVIADKFIGGAILPGIGLMSKALSSGTSKLPEVDADFLGGNTSTAIGKNTKTNIISGIIYGTAGAVERLIAEMEKEAGEKFSVIITGGYSGMVAPFLKIRCAIDRDLTLEGLRIAYEGSA